MEINIELLIAEIFKRPLLWNQKDKSYHNRVLVEKNWRCVEAKLKQPRQQLKKKWKGLRDQFRYELKRIPKAILEDSRVAVEKYDSYVTWPYFKLLLFIKDQMKRRKTDDNVSGGELSLDDNASIAQTDSEEVSIETPKKKFKCNTTNGCAELWAREQRKLNMLEQKFNQKIEQNDDEAFLNSLLPFFQNMDMNRKLLCRIDIQKTIYNYAFPSSQNIDLALQNSPNSAHSLCYIASPSSKVPSYDLTTIKTE